MSDPYSNEIEKNSKEKMVILKVLRKIYTIFSKYFEHPTSLLFLDKYDSRSKEYLKKNKTNKLSSNTYYEAYELLK